MRIYTFKREQLIPASLNATWDFFSNPKNLERITPSSLDFKIVSTVSRCIYEGQIIEYWVKPLLGIPVKWISRIENVNEPFEFMDKQIKGPYVSWQHFHRFKETTEGVMMEDHIDYQIPFQKFMPWLDQWIVRKQLEMIFDFRTSIIKDIFKSKKTELR